MIRRRAFVVVRFLLLLYNMLYNLAQRGKAMLAITYSEARKKLAGTMEKVINDFEPVLITRAKGENCVIMSYEHYRALEETAYLMRSPANARRLIESIEQLKTGKGTARELIE